jgi:peptidoglycan/LPS O-acetylase OafA/YrhL
MNARRVARPEARLQADAGAVQRTRRSSQRSLVRTIVLGTLAVLAAIVWLAAEFGMDTGDLIEYAVTSVVLVLGIVVLAVAGAATLRMAKRLFRRR